MLHALGAGVGGQGLNTSLAHGSRRSHRPQGVPTVGTHGAVALRAAGDDLDSGRKVERMARRQRHFGDAIIVCFRIVGAQIDLSERLRRRQPRSQARQAKCNQRARRQESEQPSIRG
jgi:hypothetical protein